jgi:hypothetical protein
VAALVFLDLAAGVGRRGEVKVMRTRKSRQRRP